jgi:hypothetical protein
MSYEPSHRKPPRQERWPNATPGEGWPAYEQGGGGPAWESAEAFAGSRNGYGSNGHGTAGNGYGTAGNGYGTAGSGYGDPWGGRSAAGNGYGDPRGGRGTGGNGYGDPWGGGRGTTRYSDSGTGPWAAGNGYGGATTAHPAVGDGYADGFDGAADGYAGGHADAAHGYGATEAYRETGNGYDRYDGWDGYTEPGHEFTGSAGYLPQEEYPALESGSSVLVAPDTMGEWWRKADRGHGAGRGPAHRGPVVGAMMGFLAAAVAIGVATFAAAFVRPQASPVSTVGAVFFDRLPATLRNHLMAHFGAHGQTMLLLGAIGLAAIVLGLMARRNPSIGVAGIAAFGLLGAFVAITRPASRASDVVPWVVGGLAGILALLWLARASAPIPEVESLRPAYGGRRRAR